MWLAILLNAELIDQSTDEPPTITIAPTFADSTPTWYPVQCGTLIKG
jgi:hypothetical protein